MGTPPATEWQAYRNEQAGFAVEYPPTWNLSEVAGADQTVGVTLVSAEGAVRVDIKAQPSGGAHPPTAGDIPHIRCREMILGGAPATECVDTVARSTTITLATDEKQYLITISGKPPEQATIERLLASFRLLP